MTDTFHAVTPLGTVSFEFGGWPGARMSGDPSATGYMRQVIAQCSGEDGRGIAVETMDPSDLIGFCQPAWSGVTVIPPSDLLFEQQNPGTGDVLDGVGDVASAAMIRAEILASASLARRLELARRLVDARRSGGSEAGGLRSADLAMLTQVSSGTHPDMLEPELADQIEAALARYPDDAEIAAAVERAIIAYSNGLLAAT